MLKRYNKKIKEVEELHQITCNMCEKSDIYSDEKETADAMRNVFIDSHYHSFDMKFSYGSRYDLETWSFDLCENCLEKLTNSFPIPPVKKKEYDF